jgi:hypothetical protein
MSTPELHLTTCLLLNDDGRIISTREPEATRGPLFTLVRGAASCAWAVRVDVSPAVCRELDQLAREEPPSADLQRPPVHAERYVRLLADRLGPDQLPVTKTVRSDGPAFAFPEALEDSPDIVAVHDERLLERNFRGWVPGEIAAGRAPVLAIVRDDQPASICFCARSSAVAAAAGLDTAAAHRGRGLGPRVTAAWALAIRRSGRIPLYNTSWSNHASLAVARKLGLCAYAATWGLSD